eukprot:357924-Chlamydomonas_euryale.AAC.1
MTVCAPRAARPCLPVQPCVMVRRCDLHLDPAVCHLSQSCHEYPDPAVGNPILPSAVCLDPAVGDPILRAPPDVHRPAPCAGEQLRPARLPVVRRHSVRGRAAHAHDRARQALCAHCGGVSARRWLHRAVRRHACRHAAAVRGARRRRAHRQGAAAVLRWARQRGAGQRARRDAEAARRTGGRRCAVHGSHVWHWHRPRCDAAAGGGGGHGGAVLLRARPRGRRTGLWGRRRRAAQRRGQERA